MIIETYYRIHITLKIERRPLIWMLALSCSLYRHNTFGARWYNIIILYYRYAYNSSTVEWSLIARIYAKHLLLAAVDHKLIYIIHIFILPHHIGGSDQRWFCFTIRGNSFVDSSTIRHIITRSYKSKCCSLAYVFVHMYRV